MSYEQLPDPRPAGVRLLLGRLPRWAALAVTLMVVGIFLAGIVGLILDKANIAIWGSVTVVGVLAAGNYIAAIRWADFHNAWPRRRSSRRHRSLI